MMGCEMGGMWFFGLAGLVLSGALVGVAGFVATRLLKQPAVDARGVLEQRFASGEIDVNEFEERRKVLEGSR